VKLGVNYYIAGRYASLAGLSPSAGSLLHHAVEMFLKGRLLKTDVVSIDDLKKMPYRHDLKALWQAFKDDVGRDPALDRFDGDIGGLNEFDTIRYPDRILKEGMRCFIGVAPFEPLDQPRPEPLFVLCLDQIDDLVREVFTRASYNPAAFFGGLNSDAWMYLTMHNKWIAADTEWR
jgi:hypothetical protein